MASLLQTVRSRTVLQRYPDPKAPYYLASPYTEDHQHVYTSTVDGRHPRPGLLSPPKSSLLPEGCPPQQVQSPPSYHDSLNQPGHSSLQPVTAANTTIVLAQPLVVATTSSPPKESRGGAVAIVAIAFSTCMCGLCHFFVFLPITIPALILAVCAATGSKTARKRNYLAFISIILNAVVLAVLLLFLVIFFPVFNATASYCSPYYSMTYSTYCVPQAYRAYTCIYDHQPAFLCFGCVCSV